MPPRPIARTVTARYLAVAVCLLLSCSSAWAQDFGRLFDKLDRATQTVSKAPGPEQEAAVGKQWAAILVGASKLWDNAAAQNYVNDVGRWLSIHTERSSLEWRFGVLDSDDINAFATPGGYIFITRGLLLRLSNEAELAGVLAHEIAHVVRSHHLRAMQNAASMKASGSLLSEYTVDRASNPAIARKVASGISEVLTRGLDKNDEYEADRMGVVIAARSGYDPYGLPAVLQLLGGLSPSRAELGLLFATHPTPEARLVALDKAMTPRMESFTDGLTGEARFIGIISPPAAATPSRQPSPKKKTKK